MDKFDLVVIGGGTAGLTAAGFAGKLGKKVALIEKNALGGDCTWTGCVPSKALLKVSKMAHAVRTASQYGITTDPPNVDMQAVKRYVDQAVADIYQRETPEVFSSEYNVEIMQGTAQLVDDHVIQVGEDQIYAKKVIIATGASPVIPSISGLESVPFYTNHTLFDNQVLPNHLLIIGGGPVGIEMAQAYVRLGAEVTVIDKEILPKDEPDAVNIIQNVLTREGVNFANGYVISLEKSEDKIGATLDTGNTVAGDMLLVAVGRQPNVKSLRLDNAGVFYSDNGIDVDDYLRTSKKHIFAAGDVINGPKFTHYAANQGSVAATNALLPLINMKGHDPVLPWATFTDPEIAHVGLTEKQAKEKYGDKAKTYVYRLAESDRGVMENDKDGFIKFVYKGSGTLLGATIVAERAGEMITELALVLKTNLKLRDIVSTMHAYPTYSDMVRTAVAFLLIDELFEGASGKTIKWAGRYLF